jgi:hypothetical protein
MKKIMLMDDEPDLVFTLKSALESSEEGFDVIGANN